MGEHFKNSLYCNDAEQHIYIKLLLICGTLLRNVIGCELSMLYWGLYRLIRKMDWQREFWNQVRTIVNQFNVLN